MKAKQVMKILGVTRQTLCRYLKEGKVKIKARINDKFFEYDDESVYALIGEKSNKKKNQSFLMQEYRHRIKKSNWQNRIPESTILAFQEE